MRKPAILFVNLRPRPHEGYAALVAAQKLGYEVVLLADAVPSYAREFVAGSEIVDTYQLDLALDAAQSLARHFALEGVVTWAERDVELVAHIGQMLHLPSPTPQAARRARNKFEMKQALAHIPALTPLYRKGKTLEDLESALSLIGFPSILKPVGACASKGIFQLNQWEDAITAFTALVNAARPELDPIFQQYGAEFLIEEYLPGPEYSVEGWVAQGEVIIVGITDKLTTDQFHLEYQHIFPSSLAEDIQSDIKEKTRKVIHALELDNCAFHLEGKLTSQGFRFIEVAARTGGDYITSYIIPLSTGLSFYEQTIQVAVGKKPLLPSSLPLHAGVRFILAFNEGRFRGLRNMEKALQFLAVEHVFLEKKPGEEILLPPKQFTSRRVAAFLARDRNYAAVSQTLEEIAQCCVPIVE